MWRKFRLEGVFMKIKSCYKRSFFIRFITENVPAFEHSHITANKLILHIKDSLYYYLVNSACEPLFQHYRRSVTDVRLRRINNFYKGV